MSQNNPDLNKLFPYFRNSMNYLMQEGEKFAQKYPSIAKELNFSEHKISDPHVKRVIEAFAFFDARLQYQVDDQMRDISANLLNALYPQFTAPIPSCTILQFHKMKNISQKQSISIEKNTQVKAKNSYKQECTFSTVYDLDLTDFQINQMQYVKAEQSDLAVKNSFMLGLNAQNIKPNQSVSLFINSDSFSSFSLYENILAYNHDGPTPIFAANLKHELLQKEPIGYIYPKGFSDEDALLDIPQYCSDIHRNLMEYSAFPEKFLFVDMKFNDFNFENNEIQLLIPLSEKANPNTIHLNNNMLSTNCTPAINLFPKKSEPIMINYESESYKLIPAKNEIAFEIHTIQNVYQYDQSKENNRITYNQYFGFRHHDTSKSWYHYRQPSIYDGTDAFIALVDEEMKHLDSNSATIYADLLCTNRKQAEHIKINTEFQVNKIDGVYCSNLIQPTQSMYSNSEGKEQWSLISNLSLNHISLAINRNNIETLQKMLSIYSSRKDLKQYNKKILKIEYKESIGRVKNAITETLPKIIFKITFEDSNAEIFLLSVLLSNILIKTAPFNSLVDVLILKNSNDTIWKKVSLEQ
ncbi:type VI secretion system baseplate subunit TssF [Candidatus Cytomitobacter indipagum]|nr:type VI secretion system baseplate subunit TssF [Candidatus Cytomitobacter indipagum]